MAKLILELNDVDLQLLQQCASLTRAVLHRHKESLGPDVVFLMVLLSKLESGETQYKAKIREAVLGTTDGESERSIT